MTGTFEQCTIELFNNGPIGEINLSRACLDKVYLINNISQSMKDNLVLVRCGKSSLHSNWISKESNYDLILLPYTEIDQKLDEQVQVMPVVAGQKWPAIYAFCLSNLNIIANYEYIFMPDDDLLCTFDVINKLFELVHHDKPAIAQPSLSHSSYFSHFITLQFPGLYARETSFVEIMAPVFHREFLMNAFWTINQNKSGWGAEALWNKVCKTCSFKECNNRQLIYDSVSLCHTRPVNGQSRGLTTGEIGPHREAAITLQRWKVRQFYNIRALILYDPGSKQRINISMNQLKSTLVLLDCFMLMMDAVLRQQLFQVEPKRLFVNIIQFCNSHQINLTQETPLVAKHLFLLKQ